MDILASCTLEESKAYQGRIVIENDDGKNDNVYLNIVCTNKEELSEAIKDIRSNIKCITIKGFNLLDESLVSDCSKDIFIEYSTETISESALLSDDSKIIPLCRVGESYSNMRELLSICSKYPAVRIIGGNLLQIQGVKIGRYDLGKDKGSIIYNGVYDYFFEMSLKDLDNVKELTRKVRKKLESVRVEKQKGIKSSKPAIRKSSEVSKSFNNLFGDVAEEDF